MRVAWLNSNRERYNPHEWRGWANSAGIWGSSLAWAVPNGLIWQCKKSAIPEVLSGTTWTREFLDVKTVHYAFLCSLSCLSLAGFETRDNGRFPDTTYFLCAELGECAVHEVWTVILSFSLTLLWSTCWGPRGKLCLVPSFFLGDYLGLIWNSYSQGTIVVKYLQRYISPSLTNFTRSDSASQCFCALFKNRYLNKQRL